MKHTFLFEEKRWSARGTFFTDNGEAFPLKGETVVTHDHGKWINEGTMTVECDEARAFSNRYEITPFKEGLDNTTWVSRNPDMGTLMGCFVLVHDTILSSYQSADGIYRGIEYLKKIDDVTYENRGVALKNGIKISSWATTLTAK